jgi:hypothetical protein
MSKLAGCIALWVVGLVLLPFDSYLFKIWLALPSYLVMLYGCYGLLRIGYRLYNINSEDAEFESFMGDVNRAREYLLKNKLIVE